MRIIIAVGSNAHGNLTFFKNSNFRDTLEVFFLAGMQSSHMFGENGNATWED